MAQKTKFPTGSLYMSRGVSARADIDPSFSQWCMECLKRHVNGDWGSLGAEDKRENELAIAQGNRVLSAYQRGDTKVWVITEADRRATTILFPDEY